MFVGRVIMGSNELAAVMPEKLDDNSSNGSEELGSNGSNDSCVDNNNNLTEVVPNSHSPNEVCADDQVEAVLKELGGDDANLKQFQGGEDDQVKNNINGEVNVVVEEMMELEGAFSGVFDDSRVRELIECDPFIREVVESFMMPHDLKCDKEQCGNDVVDTEMPQAE